MLDRGSDHAVLSDMTREFAFGVGDHTAHRQVHVEVVFDEALNGFDLVGFVELFHEHVTCHAEDEGLALHVNHLDGVHQRAECIFVFRQCVDQRLPCFDDVVGVDGWRLDDGLRPPIRGRVALNLRLGFGYGS